MAAFKESTMMKWKERRPSLMPVLLFVMMHVYTTKATFLLPEDCHQQYSVLDCKFSIPNKLSNNISEVNIRQYKDVYIRAAHFSDRSWSNITTLNVNSALDDLIVESDALLTFTNLARLGLHSYNVLLGSRCFRKLVKLSELDMSNCMTLLPSDLFNVLMSDIDILVPLRSLNLDYFYSSKGKVFRLLDSFFDMVNRLQIEDISMRGTNLADQTTKINLKYLKRIDISDIAFTRSLNSLDLEFERLEFLDFSDNEHLLRYFIKNLENRNTTVVFNPCKDFEPFMRLKYLIANNCFPDTFLLEHFAIQIAPCQELALEVIHFRNNNMRKIDFHVSSPFYNLTEFDLSMNELYYISKHSMTGFRFIQKLILAHNNLFEMEYNYEFDVILTYLSNLTYIDISHNRLTYIPLKMFKTNCLLRTIDLSHNLLDAINFDTYCLTSLVVLNLKYNNIKYMEGPSLYTATLLNIQGNTDQPVVLLRNNPFVCSCDSINFLIWLFENYNAKRRDITGSLGKHRNYSFEQAAVTNFAKKTDDMLSCMLEETVVKIDQQSIDRSKQMCSSFILPNSTIILFTIYVLSIIILATSLTRFLKSIRKDKMIASHVEKFITLYQKGELTEKNIIFISENVETVDPEEDKLFADIYNSINEELFNRIGPLHGNNLTYVKADNANIVLSKYRDEMADSCIAECCVLAVLVSLTEPTNDFMKVDIESAKRHGKPIVFFIQEKVELDDKLKVYTRKYPVFWLIKRDNFWIPEQGRGHVIEVILRIVTKEYLWSHNKHGRNIV